jgi:hypothetical protein
MTLRTNINARQRMAHELLDMVKSGLYVAAPRIRWALVILGDVE